MPASGMRPAGLRRRCVGKAAARRRPSSSKARTAQRRYFPRQDRKRECLPAATVAPVQPRHLCRPPKAVQGVHSAPAATNSASAPVPWLAEAASCRLAPFCLAARRYAGLRARRARAPGRRQPAPQLRRPAAGAMQRRRPACARTGLGCCFRARPRAFNGALRKRSRGCPSSGLVAARRASHGRVRRPHRANGQAASLTLFLQSAAMQAFATSAALYAASPARPVAPDAEALR